MKHLLRALALLSLVLCLILCAACGETPEDSSAAASETPTDPGSAQESSSAVSETSSLSSSASEESAVSDLSSESGTASEPAEESGDILEKVTVDVDETGIYATVFTLGSKAADKGVLEMVYYGVAGTPQADSVVNTFRVEYEKQGDGTYEVRTFYDGEVYQNLHKQTAVKVNNTFSALVRAGSVIISYTPDGGETEVVYEAAAGDEQHPIPD